jgi:hypothetical protein
MSTQQTGTLTYNPDPKDTKYKWTGKIDNVEIIGSESENGSLIYFHPRDLSNNTFLGYLNTLSHKGKFGLAVKRRIKAVRDIAIR